MAILSEGKAKIGITKEVFFNPKMRSLRDMSIAFLNAVGADGSAVDATSASGIRGIRYRMETGVSQVTLVDISQFACKVASKNLKRNKIAGKVVRQSFQDFANTCNEKFDIIDIDPFGTPTPFVYDAMKICREGSILMVTATDTAVLCGAQRLACSKMYGSVPLHNELCHEAGLRILINYILRNAAQYDFGIEVLFSIADMHYMRVFVRMHKGAKKAFDSIKEVGFVEYCKNCHSFYTQNGLASFGNKKCGHCGAVTERAGPMWLGKLMDRHIIKKMTESNVFDSYGRKLIQTINEEIDTPFFYSIPMMTKHLRIGSVSTQEVIEKLNKKFDVSATYFDSFSLKTNAGTSEVIKAVKLVAAKK